MVNDPRESMSSAAPVLAKTVNTLDNQVSEYVAAAGIADEFAHLLRLRASQINGCAYCVRLHTRDALEYGESTDRISLIAAWRDSEYFSAKERAALALIEAITLVGADPSQWISNLHPYAGVVYRQLYRGIDLRHDGAGGALKGTYEVAAGVDPTVIRWRYIDAERITVDEQGNLHVQLGEDRLVEQAPVVWQVIGGRRVVADAHYVVQGDTLQFALGDHDRRYPLTIDPTLLYSTLLGGTSTDYGRDIAVDASGNMVMAGYSTSLHFPGSIATNAGGEDVVLTKLNAQGNAIVWTTYMGGNNHGRALSLALDKSGNTVWVTGYIQSANFPTTANAPQSASNGGFEAIVLRLNDSTGAVLLSTYYGNKSSSGSNCIDQGNGIATDGAGNA